VSDSPGSSSCSACASGTYAEFEGMTNCDVCSKGTYQGSTGQSACIDCVAGTFTNINSSTSCDACDVGTYNSQSGSITCIDCLAGRFVGTTGASECFNCSAGFVSDSPGSSSCSACASGTYAEFEGMTNCDVCSKGKSQGGTGQSSCIDCVTGYYADDEGTANCETCPAGYTSDAGSESCDRAVADFYIDIQTDDKLSKECPNHAFCEGGNYLPRPASGYYIERHNKDYLGVVYRCIHKTCDRDYMNESCWLASYLNETWFEEKGMKECNSDSLQCAKGSHGALCGSCKDGYIFSSTEQNCIRCGEAWINVIPMLIFLMLGIVFVYLVRTDRITFGNCASDSWLGMLRRIDSGLMRVVWSNYQIVHSVTWSLDVEFPSPFKEMLSALSFFSFDFISLDCIVGNSDYFVTVYIWSVLPFLVALCIFVCYCINVAVVIYQSDDTESDEDFNVRVNELKVKFAYYVLLLTYIVLPTVSLKQFQGLDCFSLAGGSYLRTDTSVNCDSNEFEAFRAIDILLIMVYMSTPLIWFGILYSVRHRLNPKTKDRRLARFLRSEDSGLVSIKFLFEPYRPQYYFFEVVEIYRRVVFIGCLPLVSARSDRRAAIGVFLAIISIALYRETQPFIRQSTNLIVYVAQYAILTTFGAALAIDVQLDSGLNDFIFGVLLCFVNVVVIFLALYLSAMRYFHDMSQFRAARDRTANGKIEWAVGFDKNKHTTTLDAIAENFVSPSQCIAFVYCSTSVANKALKQGVHALHREGDAGILFTLHRPYELNKIDKAVFPHWEEAVLVCCLPMIFLSTLEGAPGLRLLKGNVLKAFRGDYFGDIADPRPWFEGGVLLPPKQIVRAFQLQDSDSVGDSKPGEFLMDEVNEVLIPPKQPSSNVPGPGKRSGRFMLKRSKSSKSMSSFASGRSTSLESVGSSLNSSMHSNRGSQDSLSSSVRSVKVSRGSVGISHGLSWENFLRTPTSCLDFCSDMTIIRQACSDRGWYPVFHYTQPFLGELIYKSGFRMSTQGQGDGGIYFSTLGPASYDVGTMEYESNIIVDCYGESRLDEYIAQQKLDLVFVYGIEPDVLTQAPGGRDNAKMISKASIECFSLPHPDGNYFLRPDRIMAAFLIDPLNPPALTSVAVDPLDRERENDVLSRQALTAAHYNMEICANETRQIMKSRPKSKSRQNDTIPQHTGLLGGTGWTSARRGSGKHRGSATGAQEIEMHSPKGPIVEERGSNSLDVTDGLSNNINIASFTNPTHDLSRENMSSTLKSVELDNHERRRSDHLLRASANYRPRTSTASRTPTTNPVVDIDAKPSEDDNEVSRISII